ncbi:SixA phosphatase family protein [Mucilaginibacter sp. X4EP1]|uniref:SixA phosphatase family protein n=1 Tax=Mucilaginibacter sp. X4EP1 TaxID=2723092 RepID=UPI0021692761|nr:histidine phosphatase family protein [Mucilaginibacter sp. X4EP1]MCS3813098.1 phosphohistidine phosphatase [Mucilaginibacter sp. X4EP1]
MKKLLLIRHAKAEKETVGKDIDRPLKYIGMQDAAFMADRIKTEKIVPQLIITSPALRTKTTAEIFADHFKLPSPTPNKAIYEASRQTWLKLINQLPAEYDFIAIVGHNPGVNQILYYLTGDAREVHTSTVALIDFDTDDWAAISGDTGKLIYYSSPKE